MAYGILKSETNTGKDGELLCLFTAPLSVISNQPSYVQDMANLRRRASSQNVQRWEIEAGLAPENGEASANHLIHTLENGHSDVFFIRMPQVHGLKTSYADIFTAATFAANVDTFSISGAMKMVPGEFVRFANHSKVYLVTAAGADGVGIRISPSLRKAVPNGTKIIVGDKVTMAARYDTNVRLGIVYTDGILSNPGTVRLVEAT